MTDPARSYRLGLAMVTGGTVAWSFAGYFTKLLTLDSFTIVFWRGVFGAATALLCVAAQKRGRVWPAFAAMGATGWLFAALSGLGMLAYLSALRYTTVAHVGIIYATIPFVAALMAWVALRERLTPTTFLASVVAFAGVALTVVEGMGEGDPLGDLLAVAMTLLMGVMIVMARRTRSIPMIPAACVSAVLAAAMAMPFAELAHVGARDMLVLAVFGVTNMGLGLILVTAGSKLIPAVETALIGTLEAPLAPFWVWLAFGETPLSTTVLGGALVMLAVVAHVLLAARRARPAPAEA